MPKKTLDDLIKEIGVVDPNNSSEESTTTPQKPITKNKLTLLDIPERKPLPPYPSGAGRVPSFVDMVINAPDEYARFIMFIQQGAYYNVAAEAIGISTMTLYNWLRRARNDLKIHTEIHTGTPLVENRPDCYTGGPPASGADMGDNRYDDTSFNMSGDDETDVDTWYVRLLYDIKKAVAICRTHREIKIADIDPRRWLTNGPGRMFGDQWSEQVNNKSGSNSEEDDEREHNLLAEIIVEQPAVSRIENHNKGEGKLEVLTLDPKQHLATIEAQEAAGLISVTEEYKDALRRQIQDGHQTTTKSDEAVRET